VRWDCWKARLVTFEHDERGATSVIYGLCFSAVFFVAAMAIDYGLGSNEKFRQQSAIDSATLAASHKLGAEDQDTGGPDAARAYYNANVRERDRGTLEAVTMNAEAGTVVATGRSSFLTSLLNGVGISSIEIQTGSKVAKGTSTVEVALVLDNSGSMSGELANLKTSTKNLLSIVFAGAQGTEKVRVGLVPFAASVNVGSAYRTASWIDGAGASPLHYQNFASQTSTRFQLLDEMGIGWGGCVEARPAPYDTTDAAPSAGTPSTLFVPMFAPDEPDEENDAGKTYNNNYLVDDAGACTPQPKTCTGGYTRRGNCRAWTKDPLTPQVAQSRTCKYMGQSKQSATGPNLNCTTAAILPLTSTRSSVETAVDGMVASGWTNVPEGVMWGWRVLSPGAPFDEGRAEGTTGNRKIMVVMTDGENTYQTQDNHNQSMYGAFGYATAGRLGATPSAMPSQMDAKLATACTNAKAAGITIYTIAFRDAATSTNIRDLLRTCASGTDKAFVATDAAGLNAAFQEIGREVSELRVAG
jgi:Mg-chelatase subunit ChlD